MLSLYEKKRNLINFIVLAIFIFLCLFLSLFHESWRDELQAWNMAKELSPAGLIAQMKYEGHPALWHFILMPFAKAGLPCDVIKLISTAFMSAAVALLLWRSPMPIIIKLLAVFGCAFWYDYAVIARSYSIIPLIMFLLADTYRQRAEKPLRYGLCLAALVQTHVIMIFFAGFLSLFFMVESFCHYRREICVFSDVRERERERRSSQKRLLRRGAGLCLPLLSLLLFMAQISGVDQSSAFQPRSYSLQTTLYGLYKTVSLYWSFNNVLSILALLCIPCCVFLAAYLHNSEKLKAVLIATASILCETLFSLFVYSYNTQRFFTWIFIWCWLLWVLWPKEKELFVFPIHSLSLFYASLLAFFMFISLPSYNGWRTAAEDIFKDYSGGKACAKFINDNLPSSAIIMQTDTSAFAAIFPWLNEGIEVYSTESGRVESFKEWHDQSSLMNNMDEVKAWVKEKAPDIHEFWIILSEAGTNSAASNSIFQWCSYRFADIEVFSNYYQCISNDEYIVCKIEL